MKPEGHPGVRAQHMYKDAQAPLTKMGNAL